MEVIGQSVEKRNLYGMLFSTQILRRIHLKSRYSFLHSSMAMNNQEKKDALLLARELLKPENKYLFDKIDLALIPQMNPDGSEKNVRQNSNEIDLNRNHLILTEPETIALHKLFNEYLFEVTMDVHEYYPYGETWQKYGFWANNDEEIGTATNLNVS